MERTLRGKGGGGGGLRTFFFPNVHYPTLWRFPERGPPPLIFWPKWGPKGRKNFFGDRPPPPLPYLNVWMTAPPPLIWRSGSATATQQNNFQNNCSAETNLLSPVQCCFLQTPKDQAFFRRHNNVASSGRGKERIAMVRMFRKKLSKCAV